MAHSCEELILEKAGESASAKGEKDVVERDIDGLPLRDHKKVDLKAILGHSPEVDDDEPEVEDDRQTSLQLENSLADTSEVLDQDAEEEDVETDICFLQRQRRSSLRAQHHDPPDSPTGDRKAVRFADSLGLGLEVIRDLADAEDPPEIPHSALTVLKLRRRRRPCGKVVLNPRFQPAVVDDVFLDRLARQHVLLEQSFVSSRELTVSGVVRVVDAVSQEKVVNIRYTTDAWTTHRDIPANYVPNSKDGTANSFVFIIHLPEGFGDETPERLERLEFAVGFHSGQDTYWDNNGGENYVIDCVMRSRESSISGETRSPDDADFEHTDTGSLDP